MREHALYDFLTHYFEFTSKYISLHYPFTTEEVKAHIRYLDKGDAHYPCIMTDNRICDPTMGLSFNKNIAWTDELKALWHSDIHLSHFQCCSDVDLLPLDMNVYLRTLDSLLASHYHPIPSGSHRLWTCSDEYLFRDGAVKQELLYPIEYPPLSPDEFISLFTNGEGQSIEILINPSIWQNTLKHVLSADMVHGLIQMKKEGYYTR